MVIIRKTKALCPVHRDGFLTAIEFPKGNVQAYCCLRCGAQLDAESFQDWKNDRHFWVGWHRNPEFHDLNNSTMEGKKEIPEYLGYFFIEEIFIASR